MNNASEPKGGISIEKSFRKLGDFLCASASKNTHEDPYMYIFYQKGLSFVLCNDEPSIESISISWSYY